MAVPARAYLSIGEVLNRLRGDFADITISKIRFLESEGLIEPQRTPSGYRKFTSSDLERLRYVLLAQRDHLFGGHGHDLTPSTWCRSGSPTSS